MPIRAEYLDSECLTRSELEKHRIEADRSKKKTGYKTAWEKILPEPQNRLIKRGPYFDTISHEKALDKRHRIIYDNIMMLLYCTNI